MQISRLLDLVLPYNLECSRSFSIPECKTKINMREDLEFRLNMGDGYIIVCKAEGLSSLCNKTRSQFYAKDHCISTLLGLNFLQDFKARKELKMPGVRQQQNMICLGQDLPP